MSVTKSLICLEPYLLMMKAGVNMRKYQVSDIIFNDHCQFFKKEIDFTIQQYLKHFYSGGGKVGKSIEVHPPTSLKETTSDNLGLFKHAPINFRKLLLSPEGLLFFLSWGSTIQVIIFVLQLFKIISSIMLK